MKRSANRPHLKRERTKIRERVVGHPLSERPTRAQKIAAMEGSTASDSRIPKAPSATDFLSDIYVWLVKRLGLKAASRITLTVTLIFVVGSFAWSHREAFGAVPGVSRAIKYFHESPLPLPLAGSHRVLVADLEGDDDHEMRDLLIKWMRWHGIDGAPLGRGIETPLEDGELVPASALTEAATLANQTDAMLLVFGQIHKTQGSVSFELYFVAKGAGLVQTEDPFFSAERNEIVCPRLQHALALALLEALDEEVQEVEQGQESRVRLRNKLQQLQADRGATQSP